MSSSKALARTAGALYLIVAVGGGFSEYVRSSVRVAGDTSATAANVAEHASLFRLGIATDLIDFVCFLGVGLLLYTMLKDVNRGVAVAMLAVNSVSVAMQSLNMLNQVGALLVATEPAYTTGMSAGASHALVLLLLDLHREGYVISQIFFGLFLLPLGYLVYRSGRFPRLLGAGLMLGSGGYIAGVALTLASPTLDSVVAIYPALMGGLSETLFLLWLLVVGEKSAERTEPTGALAWKA